MQPYVRLRHLRGVNEGKGDLNMRTTRRMVWPLVVGVALLAAATAVAGWDYEESFDETYPMAATGRVSLDNVNGDVVVETWDRAEVRVQAVRRSDSREALDGLKIEVEAGPSSVRIDTEYPSSKGWFGGGHRTEVEYTLTVPRQSRIDAIDLVNGTLRVTGVEGGVSAESVNGAIELQGVAGSVDASTVNGSIEVRLTTVGDRDDVNLESVNGGIELLVPAGTGAEVEAETVNGRISNEFDIPVHKGKWVGSDMRGTVGSGGARVRMETVNGRIAMKAL